MEDIILRGEVYSKTVLLLKHFNLLLNHEFPSEGSKQLVLLIINILEKIKQRFEIYTTRHLKLICNKFFQYIEKICGYLTESQIAKVPWSIIPAIDRLFKNLLPEFEFVVVPIWESDYRIFNKNILELFKETVIAVPDLLFDADDDFDKNTEKFLDDAPNGIYIIFFPKIERKSALHFALLGHEIGHKYALEWYQRNFNKFFRDNDLEKKFQGILEKEMKEIDPDFDPTMIFASAWLEMLVKYYKTVTSKVISELTSDIFGTLLFGETTLIALYLFSIDKNPDNTKHWKEGYLSWRYRVKLVDYTIKKIIKDKSGFNKIEGSNWESIIHRFLEKDYQDGKEDDSDCLHEILVSFETIKGQICDDMLQIVNDQLFLKYFDDKEINKARTRLKNNITPNCYIEDKQEKKIEFRNILYATWLELARQLNSDPQEYLRISNVINLLSIKGIEFSVEQEQFCNWKMNHDSNKD